MIRSRQYLIFAPTNPVEISVYRLRNEGETTHHPKGSVSRARR